MSASTGRGSARRPFLARLVAGVCALLVALLAPAPTPAQAAQPDLSVVLTSVAVSGSAPGDIVTITGTVTNRSAAPVYGVQAFFWRSSDPISTLARLDEAVTAEPPSGRQATDHAAGVATLTAPNAPLPARGAVSFTVAGTLSELNLDPDSSYFVGADATASTAPQGRSAISGSARTLATVPPTDAAATPQIATLVELASAPRRLRPNLYADDTLATELTGRLKTLVDAAAVTPHSWVIDPSLLAEVTDMADGYKVATPTGNTEGTGREAAAAWLESYRLLDKSRGYASLYGRPDLVGTGASASVFQRALGATREAKLGLPTLLVASRVDAGVLALAREADLTVVAPGLGHAKAWMTVDGTRLTGTIQPESAIEAPKIGGNLPVNRAALLLARARATQQQVRLVRNADELARDREASARWVRRVTLAELQRATPLPGEIPLPRQAPGAVTADQLVRLDRLGTNLTTYGSAAPSSGLKALAAPLASNAASEAWLADPAGRAQYLTRLEQRTGVAALRKGLMLTAPGTVTLASDRSQFPATIEVTNAFRDALKVRVVGRSDNSARVQVAASDWVTIRPGSNQTVLLTATASANGLVPVTLHVETADGLVVGDPVDVSVEATNLGTVGWIIALVSGVVLVVTTALRIRQVRRRRAS